MPRLWLIVLVAAACGGHTPAANRGEAKRGAGGDPGKRVGAGSGSGAGSAVAVGKAIPDVGCLAPSCAFHAGAGAYFTCLAGGAGACFHFGGPCAPADGCMFDPADRSYKSCAHPVEGACPKWGAACAPASACMFDPADGLSHHCDQLAGGACQKYGALCAP